MRKEIVLITGCSSWWKEKKYRKEAAKKLNTLRSQKWRINKIEKIVMSPKSIDTKVYKKYHLSK